MTMTITMTCHQHQNTGTRLPSPTTPTRDILSRATTPAMIPLSLHPPLFFFLGFETFVAKQELFTTALSVTATMFHAREESIDNPLEQAEGLHENRTQR